MQQRSINLSCLYFMLRKHCLFSFQNFITVYSIYRLFHQTRRWISATFLCLLTSLSSISQIYFKLNSFILTSYAIDVLTCRLILCSLMCNNLKLVSSTCLILSKSSSMYCRFVLNAFASRRIWIEVKIFNQRNQTLFHLLQLKSNLFYEMKIDFEILSHNCT